MIIGLITFIFQFSHDSLNLAAKTKVGGSGLEPLHKIQLSFTRYRTPCDFVEQIT